MQQNEKSAVGAYNKASTPGNLETDAQTGEKFAKNEYSKKDLKTDEQISAKKAKTNSFSKGQAMSDGKKAFSTDAA